MNDSLIKIEIFEKFNSIKIDLIKNTEDLEEKDIDEILKLLFFSFQRLDPKKVIEINLKKEIPINIWLYLVSLQDYIDESIIINTPEFEVDNIQLLINIDFNKCKINKGIITE